MTGKLEFNLPEERDEFDLAINGWKYKSVLAEFDNYLRSKVKYAELSEEQYQIFEEIRTELWNMLKDAEITPF
jgi:hypothetical protein